MNYKEISFSILWFSFFFMVVCLRYEYNVEAICFAIIFSASVIAIAMLSLKFSVNVTVNPNPRNPNEFIG